MASLIALVSNASNIRTVTFDDGWMFSLARSGNWYPADVPGTVHTDLMSNGLIGDPYFGMNERSVQWVDKEDWIYETVFDLCGEIYGSDHMEIVFDGLDTYADVYLNDSLLFSAGNMFRRWRADIKGIAKKDGNRLRVYFHSPIKVDLPKWEALPFDYEASNDQSQNGGLFGKRLSVFARKAGYHYGWDWGPRIVTSGIWRDVRVEAWNCAKVEDVYYCQTYVSKERAEITACADIVADRDIPDARITVSADGKTVFDAVRPLKAGKNSIGLPFIMKKPKLWWTKELGEPYLYDFSFAVDDGGREVASARTSVGIRSIRLVRDDVSDGRTFRFELNGVPVFMKGANYIPCDIFLPRVTKEVYERTVEDAAAVNMNMLRVWGGGVYEDDYFYELCDRYGILVWQDFMFACSLYPAEGEWLENVRAEAEDNLRRLRNHPSVALWCGNNECQLAWFNWGWRRKFEKRGHPEYDSLIYSQQEKLYYDVLADAVSRFSLHTDYTPSSPFADRDVPDDPSKGDTHNWLVWHGNEPIASYCEERGRFFSEYGFQSFPGVETIRTFAPDTAFWRIDSDVMMSHQRGGEFANMRIAQYMEREYWKPAGFADFVYMSQVLQGDAIRTAIEAHRRDKPYCWGTLFWQHNDCWPVASWSSRDWYGCWKAQHYLSEAAFDDILVSPVITGRTAKIFIVSDRLSKCAGTLSVKVVDVYGKELLSSSRKVSVAANSSGIYYETGLPESADASECVVSAVFACGDGKYESIRTFALLKDMKLPECRLDVSVVPVDGGLDVTVSSDKFARSVWMTIDGVEHHFSDNFFDLMPGCSRTVNIKTRLTEEEFLRQLRITHAAMTRNF